MRLPVFLALVLLLPSGLAQLPADGDPAAALESLAASRHVPRNEGIQRLDPPAPGATDPTGPETAPADPLAPPGGPPGAPPDELLERAGGAGIAAPVPGAKGDLVAALAAATSADDVGTAMAEYYAAAGLVPRFADVDSRPSQFDENQTVTFTYSIGDIDGDGVGDLLLDKYCPYTVVGCPGITVARGAASVSTSTYAYGQPHLVEAISGADGRPLWNMSMDRPHPTFTYSWFASMEFIVGTVPLEDGTYGLLTYRYLVTWFSFSRFEITHEFQLYETVGGNVVWQHQEDGIYLAYLGAAVADTVIIHPHLDVPPADGPYLAPEGSQHALTLVGVGYTLAAASTSPVAPPSWDHFPVIVQDFQPDEWAAQLVPQTGEERWRVTTFSADRSRSVLPNSWWGASIAGGWLPPDGVSTVGFEMINRANSHYWGYRPCCHDLDGDGHPELVYTTLEFTNFPNANTNGPYGYESRLLVFSGADGSLLYQHWLAQDHEVFFVTTRVLALGDVDADGMGDFLLERMTLEPRPEYIWTIRSGHDGEVLWQVQNVRRMDLLIPGDVDADGGNDLLLLEWFQHEYYGDIGTPYANVTHTPIKVFSGATGELLWRRESFIAAADLDRMVDNGRINGFPDLDGDGVQDIPLMDPIYLPDGTVIHRTSFFSPVSDKRLATAISAGLFAVPVRAGDINGDGREDFTLLNGDLLDLWVTTYDGRTGDAIWSRRITDLRLSSAAAAIPLLRNHDVPIPGGARVDIVVNFQMSYTTLGGYLATSSNRQMVTGLIGLNGTLVWSQPRVYDPEATQAIAGASPASALFAELLRTPTLSEQLSTWTPTPLGGGAAFVGAALFSFLLSRRLTP